MNYDFTAVRKHSLDRISKHLLAGQGALIKIGGETVWEDYTGFSSIENNVPVTADSIFRLASMTKPVTAVCIMQLFERGKLGLLDDVSKYVPELKEFRVAKLADDGTIIDGGKAHRGITIFDILTHTSGLAQGDLGYRQSGEFFFSKYYVRGAGISDVMPHVCELLLDSEPGAAMGYGAHVPFDLLGYIVELASGIPFGDYVRENVTAPLGMRDTTFHLSQDQKKRLVGMYEAGEPEAKLVFPDVFDGMIGIPESLEIGSAGLFGTVPDYSRFAEMLLGLGTLDGVRILNETSVRLMSTPLVRPGTIGYNMEQVWGLSMRVINSPSGQGPLPSGTFGWSGAYGTHFFVCPEKDLTAVYFINLINAGTVGGGTAVEFEADVFGALN
ncbi:MAG: beta-lactamase family protein [Clostridia bacterium]|nr:beta-lactamase family protein [Clostridia bacterium]